MRRVINFLINLGSDIPQKKLSIAFLIDLSGSMQGEPLEKVKIALSNILQPLVKYNSDSFSNNKIPSADQVLLMTFESEVQKICPWVMQENFDFFKECLLAVPDIIFNKTGVTSLYDGLYEAVIQTYKGAKKSNEKVIVIFSDGHEYGSKRKKSEVISLIKQYKNGFVNREDINNILQSYDLKYFKDVFVDIGSEILIFQDDFSSDKIKFMSDENLVEQLLKLQKESCANIKVSSVHYSSNIEDKVGKDSLNEFAELTSGKVYSAPTLEEIPTVLNDVVLDILYETKNNFRTKLIRRLKYSTYSQSDLGNDWFRVFSLNSITTEVNKNDNNSPHKIFEVNLPVGNDLTREKILSSVKGHFNNNILQAITSNVIDQNEKIKNIEDSPYIFFITRGNDLLGISIASYLIESLNKLNEEKAYQLFGKNINAFLIVLLDDYIHYSNNEKNNLFALITETIQEENIFDSILLIQDRNDSSINKIKGYKSLSKLEFPELVLENLYSLNINQQMLDTIIVRSDKNRLYSMGGVSVKLDLENIIDKGASYYAYKFLNDSFDERKIRPSNDDIATSTNSFLNELSFTNLKHSLLKSLKGKNLFEQIETPSIDEGIFTPFRGEIEVRYPSHLPDSSPYIIKKLQYKDEIEYVRLLLYDVREYVESCDAIEIYKSEIDKKYLSLASLLIESLKSISDHKLYGNTGVSSPVQLKAWLENIYKRIINYLEEGIEQDIRNDDTYKTLQNFNFTTSGGSKIDESEIDVPFKLLKEKLSNFPLPFSVRTKYHSFSFLLFSGITALILSFPISGWSFLFYTIPIFNSAWGEYKIRQSYKQVSELIKWYAAIHNYKAKKLAFNYLSEKIKLLLQNILEKIKREQIEKKINPYHFEDYSEFEILQYFEQSCKDFLSKQFDYPSDLAELTSPFSIDLFNNLPFTRPANQIVELLIKGITNYNFNCREVYDRVITNNINIERINFPRIETTFLPLEIKNISAQLRLKLYIQELIKDKKYNLILLENFSKEEIEEVKRLYESPLWHLKIDELTSKYQHIYSQTDNNIIVLWRDIVIYQLWLQHLASLVTNQSDNVNGDSDYLYNLWEKVYKPRKIFKQRLYELFVEEIKIHLISNINLWKLINEIPNKEDLLNHINSYSFPAFHLNISGDSYPPYDKIYFSSGKNSPESVQRNFNIKINDLLEPINWQTITVLEDDFSICFSTYIKIPIENSDLLRNMYQIFPKNFEIENGEWSKYFIGSFIDKYLNKPNKRKNYNFPISYP